MRRPIAFLGTVLAFAAIAFFLVLVLSPARAVADVTMALDGLPYSGGEQVPMIPLLADTAPTVTLTNLRSGSTHGGLMTLDGRVRIEDVPPGYYQVRITSKHRYHLDYIVVDAKDDTALRYNWRDMYFRFAQNDRSDTELINTLRDGIIATAHTGYQEGGDNNISGLRKLQEIHRHALNRLESLGPKAIRAVGPPRFDSWRQIHQRAINQVDAAFDQTTRDPASAGTGSAREQRAELEEQQSQLERQHESQAAELAAFTPKFLERRQYLLEKLPASLQTNLARAGNNADPASFAAVSRTYEQIQNELQDAANKNASTGADLTRLKILYEQMNGYYSALFVTEIGIAVMQREIAKIVEDNKTVEKKKTATAKKKSNYSTGTAAGDRGN
jgi:hypothetical protein